MHEDLKYTFTNINDWLKFAEAKNVALTTLNGAILFGLLQSWDKIPTSWRCEIEYILLPLLFLSILICIWTFIPELNYNKLVIIHLNEKKGEKFKKLRKKNAKRKKLLGRNINYLFYGHIRHLTVKELIIGQIGALPTDYDENKNLAAQIIVNSKISWKKYIRFRIAGNITIWSFIICFIAIVLDQVTGWDFTSFLKYIF